MSENGFAAFVLRARAKGVNEPRVLRAIEESQRAVYADTADRARVFLDHVLPIGCGQAMERLDDAAVLLDALGIEPHHRVLELGTGSGFLTEVISRLARNVVTVDRYRGLLVGARERHAKRGRENIKYLQRDIGALPDLEGPFDRIYSSVAFGKPPRSFIEHLVAEGILVAPIGDEDGPQRLTRLAKVGARFDRTELGEGWFPSVRKGVALAL